MTFGVRHALGTFQQTMDVIMTSVKQQYALVYFDNIVVFTKTPERHCKHVLQVLNLSHRVGVTLNVKKYSVFTNMIGCLGHVIHLR